MKHFSKSAEVVDLLRDSWHFDCVLKLSTSRQRCQEDESVDREFDLDSTTSVPHIQLLHEIFSIFDENGDGLVDSRDISRVVEKLGLPPIESTSSAQALMAGSAIINNEQYVDKRKFSQFYSTVCDGNCDKESTLMRNSSDSLGDESKYATIQTHGDEDLVDAFNVFDKDRNGLISANELRSVLISLGFSQETCAIEACTAIIARVDKNADAHVDVCEFTSLLRLECHHDSCGILAL